MHDKLTQRLLTAGIVAGPLVLIVGGAQAFLVEGFDIQHHASSQLALGEYGWIQAVNFIVAGVLTFAFAIGARRALKGTPGGFWMPLLLGVYAICHVLVGFFPTDPAFGWPPGPGTPAGIPSYDSASTHAMLHSLFAGIGFNSLAAAFFVLAWRFGRSSFGWMVLSFFAGATIISIAIYGGTWEAQHTDPLVRATASFNFLPMWACLPVVWGSLSALAWKFRNSAGSDA